MALLQQLGCGGAIILTVAVFLPPVVLLCTSASFPATLKLERAIINPMGHTANNLSDLIRRDRVRHGRMLQQSFNGVVGYALGGPFDLSVGLYYARVQIGTPPQDFYLQVDTGSDLTWVGCISCADCPLLTRIPNVTLHLYNPESSSSHSSISCLDDRCPTRSGSSCSADSNNLCSYSISYGDNSEALGFYFQDLFNYETIQPNFRKFKSTAPLVFGCSTKEPGFQTNSQVDGILGFGHQSVSVISQLANQGLTPNAFSHCLTSNGGILVLGEIIEPNIVYTPLLPSMRHYNVEMEEISVNGQTLPIDPSSFSSPTDKGTIIDSGTTLAYFPSEAFDKLITAVNLVVSPTTNPIPYGNGNLYCYQTAASVNDVFPQITLTFKGGAELILGPQDYLLHQEGLMDGSAVWCLGFLKNEDVVVRPTVLGDIVMKNKFFIYDVAGQRIGWTNYNCSAEVNVSTGFYSNIPKRSSASKTTFISTSITLILMLLFIDPTYPVLWLEI